MDAYWGERADLFAIRAMGNEVAVFHDYFCQYTNGLPHEHPMMVGQQELLSSLSRRLAFTPVNHAELSGFELLSVQVVQIQAATRPGRRARTGGACIVAISIMDPSHACLMVFSIRYRRRT